MTPIEGELRAALGTNLAAMMTSIQNGSGNYSIQLTPIEERDAVAAGADAGRAPRAEQVQERAHQRLGRHRHLGRLDRRRRRRPRRRRRRRRRQHEPPQHDRPGARHRAAAGLRRGRCWRRSARSTASPTPTRASRRRSPSCGSTSIASARPTSASRSTRCRRRCARWSAARRSRSTRTATSSSASGCGSTSSSATTRRRWGTSSCPAAGGRMVRVSDVAHLALGSAPGSIDRYNRMRQISVNANLDRLKITLGDAHRRGARARSASWV